MLLYGSKGNENQAFTQSVLSIMWQDQVSFIAKRDELIVKYGCWLFEKDGSQKPSYITEKMRSLARLVIELTKISSEKHSNLAEFICASKFDVVIQGTRNLCSYKIDSYNDNLATFDRPSLALKIGHALKRCAGILRGVALRKKDKDLKEDADSIVDLINVEWASKVSATALRTLNDSQFNKAPVLPLTEDLVKVRKFLVEKIPIATKGVLSNPEISTWRNLAELTVSRIILLNKRRGNEGSKVELSQFANRAKWSEVSMDEMGRSLKPLELELCKRLDLVYVRGKRGRKVPILMTAEIVNAVNALIKTRDNIGVHPENRYIFAAPTRMSKKFLRGPDCFNSVVKQLDLKNPNAVKSAQLRKYVATVSQVIDLSESELDW
eukprot:gene1368-1512_t